MARHSTPKGWGFFLSLTCCYFFYKRGTSKTHTRTHRNERWFHGCRFSHNTTWSCKTGQSEDYYELAGKTNYVWAILNSELRCPGIFYVMNCTLRQDCLHNSQVPATNRNAGLLVHKALRISRWNQQSIQPSTELPWLWALYSCTGCVPMTSAMLLRSCGQ